MSRLPQEPQRKKRSQGQSFRPRFTIGIFYIAGFFFLFAFLQIMPDLIQLLELPPGPDQLPRRHILLQLPCGLGQFKQRERPMHKVPERPHGRR
ncbi:MAG: hypothetical protein CMN75_02145, partial [Spirochaeta sp.]|nr:hypothetical protein [Spirochaeta sp.]